MKLKNIINNFKLYNFENPEIIKEFQNTDIESAGIMLKRSRNLKNLCYPIGNNSASLLFVTEDVDKIKLLLNYDNSTSAFYNATDRYGYHVLAKTDNEAKAKLIINEYKDKYVLDHIMSAQTFVEANENVKIVEMLIKAGGSPSKGYFGATVLESAQNIEKFRLLLQYGAKINVLTKNDITLIEKIEERSKYHDLYFDELIKDKNFDPNFKNKDGQAIVFLVNDKNKLKIIEHKNFDFNVRNKDNEPLLYVFKDNNEALDKIIKKVDLQKQNYEGNAPLFYIENNYLLNDLYGGKRILSIKDKNGDSGLFSKEISDNKFTYMLVIMDLKNIELNDSSIFDEKNNESIAINLIKRKDYAKLKILLDYNAELAPHYMDSKNNNLLAYASSADDIKIWNKKYKIPLDHKNKHGSYSVLESIPEYFAEENFKTLINELDNKEYSKALDIINGMFEEPMVLIDKKSILNKLENHVPVTIQNNKNDHVKNNL